VKGLNTGGTAQRFGSAWVIDDLATLASVTDGKTFGVLELNGHGNFDGELTYGASGTRATPKNAAQFGRDLKQQVLKDKAPGVLILHFCLTGTYTRQDSPGNAKSVAQIVANETGWTVLSAGGFAVGHFAKFYVPDESVLIEPGTDKFWRERQENDDETVTWVEKTNWQARPELKNDNLAYESGDDVWYLTTPE
jgi:hypothetical protein